MIKPTHQQHRSVTNARLDRRVSLGLHLSFLNPDLVEFCGVLGFQWLFLDAQRTPVTPATCRDLVRAADLAGMFCVARVSRLDAIEIESFLDAGVRGIIVPNIESAIQVEELIAAVKFPPCGRRGASLRSRAASYGLGGRTCAGGSYQLGHDAHYAAANEATFTAALIETQRGLDHLGEILGVPGLDYIALGPNDLALALRKEGATESRIQALIDDAIQRLHLSGKPQIAVVADSEGGRDTAARGATLVAISDAQLLSASGFTFLESMSSLDAEHA